MSELTAIDRGDLTLGTGAHLLADRLHVHAITAAQHCETLRDKRVHPYVLRHSCAMALLQASVDSTVIALWLGHADTSSTQPYIHADMTIKNAPSPSSPD